MTLDIIRARLRNQGLVQTELSTPEQVVAWFGAVQAQEYASAKWALGLRVKDATDAAIDRAFQEGRILRTHVLRPTWHFVTPTDIRWMLVLTAPRVRMAMAYNDRQLGLEPAILEKSRTALAKTLQGDRQLTRSQLAPALQQAGLRVDGMRLGHLLMHAELEGLICSGPRRGKQFTYALLEERAPQAITLARDVALAELARRYFRSHGPATVQDFAWWSGLTLTEARQGIEAVRSEVEPESVEDKTYWSPASRLPPGPGVGTWLLPNYDEYTVGYTDRTAIFDSAHMDRLRAREGILAQSLLIDGRIAGTWKRTIHKDRITLQLEPFVKLDPSQARQIADAGARYGEFLDMPVELVM